MPYLRRKRIERKHSEVVGVTRSMISSMPQFEGGFDPSFDSAFDPPCELLSRPVSALLASAKTASLLFVTLRLSRARVNPRSRSEHYFSLRDYNARTGRGI
jgi:hypothetical protein